MIDSIKKFKNVNNFISYCHKYKYVDLSELPNIQDEHLKICSHCLYVDISNCDDNITNKGIYYLKSLVFLVYNNKNITINNNYKNGNNIRLTDYNKMMNFPINVLNNIISFIDSDCVEEFIQKVNNHSNFINLRFNQTILIKNISTFAILQILNAPIIKSIDLIIKKDINGLITVNGISYMSKLFSLFSSFKEINIYQEDENILDIIITTDDIKQLTNCKRLLLNNLQITIESLLYLPSIKTLIISNTFINNIEFISLIEIQEMIILIDKNNEKHTEYYNLLLNIYHNAFKDYPNYTYIDMTFFHKIIIDNRINSC